LVVASGDAITRRSIRSNYRRCWRIALRDVLEADQIRPAVLGFSYRPPGGCGGAGRAGEHPAASAPLAASTSGQRACLSAERSGTTFSSGASSASASPNSRFHNAITPRIGSSSAIARGAGSSAVCPASCRCAPLAASTALLSGQAEAGVPVAPRMPVSAATPGNCAVRRSLRDRRCGPRTGDGGNMMGAAHVDGRENAAQPSSQSAGRPVARLEGIDVNAPCAQGR
jgi:hypothetical protein